MKSFLQPSSKYLRACSFPLFSTESFEEIIQLTFAMSSISYLSNLNTLSQVAATIQTEMGSDNESEDIFAATSQDIKNTSYLSSPISSPLESEECFGEKNVRFINSGESLELVNSLLCLKRRRYSYGPGETYKNVSVPRSLQEDKCLIKGSKLQNNTNLKKHKFRNFQIKKRQGQGRPYTNTLKARFYIHDSIEELYCYLNNIPSFRFHESSSSKQKVYHSTKSSPRHPHFKTICFNNLPPTTDLFDKLCEAFKIEEFKFVRINRNVDGKIINVETVRKTDSTITAEWIKQNVCRPRYKSNMKISLIRSNQPMKECIYKDKNAFELDIENVYNSVVKIVD